MGWAAAGDGKTCLAPVNYEGSCEKSVDFGGLTPGEKMALAVECGARFPCEDQCEKNWNASCPAGWSTDADSGRCRAPDTYNGSCVPVAKFSHLSSEGKARWEELCGV